MNMRSLSQGAALVLVLMFTASSKAQPPVWERNVHLQISNPVTAFTADGYGLHVITDAGGSTFGHYLIGNDGQVISANSENIHPTRISEFGLEFPPCVRQNF